MAPATADWSANKIKARVIERNHTLKGLSVDAGLHPDACSKALRMGWRAAERAIADALGEKPETIWPSRYNGREDRTWKPRSGSNPSRPATSSPAPSAEHAVPASDRRK